MFRSPSPRSKPCRSSLLLYTALLFPSPLSLLFWNPPAPTQPPPRAQLCRTRELNVFKGVRRGPSNPQRRLGSGSPPSRFIASVLPKSYFTVPSIRSLGSPQLPSPDAGLSPSLGTRTGHGEREACDTHQQAQQPAPAENKRQRRQQAATTKHTYYNLSACRDPTLGPPAGLISRVDSRCARGGLAPNCYYRRNARNESRPFISRRNQQLQTRSAKWNNKSVG